MTNDSKQRVRIYPDTSVVGGCFDPEFERESRRFFDLVRRGRVFLRLGDVLIRELEGAPERVREVLASLPAGTSVQLPLTPEMIALRDAYIRAGIVDRRSLDDAAHVAAATVAQADAIVSWNFKHIVRLDKITLYNEVNLANGYGTLTIVPPWAVRFDDEE